MVCDDGRCCSGDAPTTSAELASATAAQAVRQDAGSSRCCSESNKDSDACCDESCLRSVALQECSKTCAGETEGTPLPNSSSDNCANNNNAVPSEKCCASDGNSVNEGVKAHGPCVMTKPSCGKQAAKPCCSTAAVPAPENSDNSCERKTASNANINGPTKQCCSSEKPISAISSEPRTEPCPSHLEATRRRYSNVFGAMSCMCKALLAQGLESCCATKRKLSPERIRQAPSSRSREKCSTKERGTTTSIEQRDSSGSNLRSLRNVKDGCCGKSKTGSVECATNRQTICARSTSGCCKSKSTSPFDKVHLESTKTTLDVRNDSVDLERGSGTLEHVALSVQGMTCTGCETKLNRSINGISSAKNAQVSIVLSRAEFDVDPNTTSVEQAIAQLERATGFVLTQLSSAGNELRVLETADSRHLLDEKLPFGVLNVKRLDEDAISIFYDASAVGARDLLERSFGVKLNLAPIRPPANIAAGAKHVRHVGYMTLLSSVMTIPVLVFAWAPLPPHEVAYQSTSLALATIVQVVVGGPFYSSALRSLLFSGVIEMDLLIVLSTTAAYVFSVVAYAHTMSGKPLSTGEFFESSTLLMTLIMVGRFVSAFARQKAVESISVSSLQPTTAALVDDDGNVLRDIDSRLLHYGDVFRVMPDSRVVTDGTVVFGQSEVDESMITGESRLIAKNIGSSVVAGAVNQTGLLHVRVALLPSENTISSIAEMVDRAKLSKPKIQEFADKVAGYFVPVVVAITIIVFGIWIGIGMRVRKQSGADAVVNALTYAIAVLIVSCPCAVGLAVPMVIVIACGVGAERGVVFKSAQSIESSWRATHVVFDKTGTLTEGRPSVVEEEYLAGHRETHLPLLLGLVSQNKHPNSTALARFLTEQGVDPTQMDFLDTVIGKGVEGRRDGKVLRAGNAVWLAMENYEAVKRFQNAGLTTLCFDIDGKPQAVFGLSDTLRPEARSVVSTLLSRDVAVTIVSGDDHGAVESVGHQLGVDSSNLKAKCSPQDKQQYVESLTQDKKNIVIFCGDGSNDAGALAQASIGLHMSEGTDVARSASDAVLMRPDIAGLLTLMDISHAAYRRIVVNFCWAGIYNLFAILLAAGAFVDFRIPPRYAGLGELVSVLPVIVVAVQLRWARF